MAVLKIPKRTIKRETGRMAWIEPQISYPVLVTPTHAFITVFPKPY